MIVSKDGGKRQMIGHRWDLIPGGFQSLRHVAKIAHEGAAKYGLENWKSLDPESEQSPLNHGIAHSFAALGEERGSPERIRQLAKAAWNLLAAIWFEERARRLK